jgi:radical SAM-linked protein
MSLPHPLEPLLPEVIRPQQYIGCEWNMEAPAPGRPDVTLVYPDIYELGMSNFGLSVVRHLLVATGKFNVRRAYCPSPDMWALLEGRGIPWTCSDGFPVSESSVIGFGVPSESLYTNVLNLISLAGIPTRSLHRRQDHPVVLAGGGGISNPLPLSPFVDVFYLGDAEENAADLFGILSGPGPRSRRVEAASVVPGVWVPHMGRRRVEIQKAPALLPEWAPTKQLVPLAEITHDRAMVEIARGCTRGCRFCQATQLSRPVRERSPADVLSLLEAVLSDTGWEDAGLLSLSFSDYSCLPGLLQGVAAIEKRMGVNVSRPSLRPDSFARLSSGARLAGRVTLAPEAGSERLRRKLNKPMEDSEILGAVDSAFTLGAKGVKLYFMIGLPGEDDEDLEALASLSERACGIARTRGRPRFGAVTVALSPFVPKAHTPLQWAPQLPEEETWRRVNLLRVRLRQIKPGWNDPRLSLVEAVLGLGDDLETSLLLEEASGAGARFDAWTDRIRWDVWRQCLDGHPALVERVRSGLDPGAEVPWSFVSTGVSAGFLKREFERFSSGTPTPDCRDSGCNGCGVCGEAIGNSPPSPEVAKADDAAPAGAGNCGFLRVRWGRTGLARFSSHLDMVRLWARAVRRSGLPAATRGAHVRRVRLRFGPALPLGFESTAEVVDIQLAGEPGRNALRDLAGSLPPGFDVLGVERIDQGRVAPDAEAVSAEYEVDSADPGSVFGILSASEGIEEVSTTARGGVQARARLGSASTRIDRLLSQAGVQIMMIRRTGLFGAGGERLPSPGSRQEGEDLG